MVDALQTQADWTPPTKKALERAAYSERVAYARGRAQDAFFTTLQRFGDFKAAAAAAQRAAEGAGLRVTGQRAYSGASKGRRTQHWLTSSKGPNSEIQAGVKRLRDRTRDLIRNNAHMSRGLRILANSIVGPGLKPQSKVVVPPALRSQWDAEELNELVEGLWRRWVREVDVGSDQTLYGLQVVMVRAMLQDGDVFVRRRPRRSDDGLTVPLQVQLIESDHLVDDRDETLLNPAGTERGKIIQGIEFDAVGRRRAYHLYRDHPGEFGVLNTQRQETTVPADQIAHLYECLRPGQVRGVPWFAPIILTANDLAEADEAEMVRRKLAACMFAAVSGGNEDYSEGDIDGIGDVVDSDGSPTEDVNGNPLDALEPGLILHLEGGKQITLFKPESDSTYPQYRSDRLHEMAAGINVTFADLTGDLSGVNFSSARYGDTRFRPVIRCLQIHYVVPLVCDPIYDWFIDAAIAAGLLPDGILYEREWMLPQFEEVDQVKDLTARYLRVRGGFTSRSMEITAMGNDAEAVRASTVADNRADDAAELVVDTDPRKQTKAGQYQSAPPPDTDGEAPEDESRQQLAAAVARAIEAGDNDAAMLMLAGGIQ